MPLGVEVEAALKGLLSRPDLFVGARAAAEDVVHKAVLKGLKAAKLNVATLREVQTTVGSDNLKAVVDAMPAKDVATLLKKLDPYDDARPEGVAAYAKVYALASASVEPVAAMARATKTKARAKDQTPKKNAMARALASKSMGAARARPKETG